MYFFPSILASPSGFMQFHLGHLIVIFIFGSNLPCNKLLRSFSKEYIGNERHRCYALYIVHCTFLYFCRLLFGFSEIVISTNPSLIAGSKLLSLKVGLCFKPSIPIKSLLLLGLSPITPNNLLTCSVTCEPVVLLQNTSSKTPYVFCYISH